MPRPIWSGSISFGLVNIPVKLYSAVSHKEVHFHLLHDEDGARIRFKRVCSADGEEVAFEHVVKGLEIAPGQYVTTTQEELSELLPEMSKRIDIEDFVDASEIDPIYYEATYYLAPDRGAGKAYRLLREAIHRAKKVGIARMVLRTRQYLCCVRTMRDALVVSTLLYADEIVPVSEIAGLAAGGTMPAPRELTMAEQLVDSLAAPFKPEKYHDEYRDKVLALLESKAEGETISAPEPAVKAKVVNLHDALTASLEAARKRKPVRQAPAIRKEKKRRSA